MASHPVAWISPLPIQGWLASLTLPATISPAPRCTRHTSRPISSPGTHTPLNIQTVSKQQTYDAVNK